MVPAEQPKVALQHPAWGGVSIPTPGAAGTALLLVGQVSTRWRSARSHPARMTRLKGHHSPPRCTFRMSKAVRVFGKLACPANQRLDRFSLLVGQTKRDAILVCAEPVILLPGRPFTLTHEICSKFNEGYTLHRMANYGYASGIDRFGLHKRL